jgi:hypothetical protein
MKRFLPNGLALKGPLLIGTLGLKRDEYEADAILAESNDL